MGLEVSFSGDSVRLGVFNSRSGILKPGSRSLTKSPFYNSIPLSSIRFQREPRSNHLDLPSRKWWQLYKSQSLVISVIPDYK